MQRKTATRFDEKVIFLIDYIDTHQKSSCLSITFVAINHEEMLKKDFAFKYFLVVKAVAIRTNPLQ